MTSKPYSNAPLSKFFESLVIPRFLDLELGLSVSQSVVVDTMYRPPSLWVCLLVGAQPSRKRISCFVTSALPTIGANNGEKPETAEPQGTHLSTAISSRAAMLWDTTVAH